MWPLLRSMTHELLKDRGLACHCCTPSAWNGVGTEQMFAR